MFRHLDLRSTLSDMNPPGLAIGAPPIGCSVRAASRDDLPQVIRLLESARANQDLHLDLADVVADLGADDLTVVAAVENDVVGALIGRLEGETGRILAIVVAPEWRDRRVGASLIEYAESQLFGRGARKVTALIADGRVGSLSLAERGFEAIRGLALYEKAETIEPSAMSVLHRWGGELVPPERWDEFSGLRAQREVVDERVLAPLLESDLAERFGVVPPTTMLLFGPPGTGKTSFAKAVAGRLGWPFVEILPSKLGAEGLAMMADELHNAFEELLSLEHAVIFIDEVDDIASSRAERPESQAVVNELLKAVVRIREAGGRLLVCATNSIGSLDPAVVRPGRFDLVLPVGPPDSEARAALLGGMLESIQASVVDAADFVEETEGLTPADLASAVQRAASDAFGAARHGEPDALLDAARLRRAIRATVPTISADALAAFHREADRFQRV